MTLGTLEMPQKILFAADSSLVSLSHLLMSGACEGARGMF